MTRAGSFGYAENEPFLGGAKTCIGLRAVYGGL
jgi:hypothetical protein